MNNAIYAIFIIFSRILRMDNLWVDKKKEQKTLIEKDTSEVQSTQEILNTESKQLKTINVDYLTHMYLLHILTLLPTSTMIGWVWDPNERKELEEFIKQNNFFLYPYRDKDLWFNTPNNLGLFMYGGYFWTLSIYKIVPHNYIVIVNDYDGRDNIIAFEYKSGKLKAIKVEDLFGDVFSEILNDKNDSNCIEFVNENGFVFEYYLQDTTKVEISNICYLKENECKDYLKGNTLNYEFNPNTKKFDLIEVKWVEYKEQ